MSIRFRLALWYAFALGLTLALAGAVTWWEVGDRLRAGLETTLETRAAGVVTAIENVGQVGLQDGDMNPGGLYVAIFDANGLLVDASATAPPGIPAISGAVALAGGSYLQSAVRASDGSLVITGASTAALDASRNDLARAVLLGVTPAAALSLLAGIFLAGRALRPVDRMTAEAAAIGRGDLERRVAEPTRRDELGRLAHTLNAMLERISTSVATQRAFVAEASHELRTPLAALRAELELADQPGASAATLRQALRAAQADAGRLAAVADVLLQRAMSADDQPHALRRTVAISDVVLSSVQRVALPARHRRVRVVTTVTAGSVDIDRVRMEQAIANLVQNAVAHGPAGSTVQINSRVAESGSVRAWLVEVLDRGPGIRHRTTADLFAEDVSGDAPSGRRGFGLAIVRSAVDAHAGTFGAENRADGGARFWFSVPV